MSAMKYADNILITGASSGIGEALALECARRGAKRLFLCGRDSERLEGVAVRCRAEGADVRAEVLDVADEAAVRAWVNACDAQAPLELVFSNAGIGTGVEDEANIRRTFATNVTGNLNVVLPTLARFRAAPKGRARRQVVITASLAGYAPLSTCPAYAATKAAMKAWALSFRRPLAREGIRMNVVCPGQHLPDALFYGGGSGGAHHPGPGGPQRGPDRLPLAHAPCDLVPVHLSLVACRIHFRNPAGEERGCLQLFLLALWGV